MGLRWVIGRVVRIVRPRAERLGLSTSLWGITGLVGTAATFAGMLALVELLMLADLMSAPIVGGPSVSGVSPIFATAGLLVTATVLLGTVAVIVSARSGTLRGAGSVVEITALTLLAAWAGYWGFFPLPSVG